MGAKAQETGDDECRSCLVRDGWREVGGVQGEAGGREGEMSGVAEASRAKI